MDNLFTDFFDFLEGLFKGTSVSTGATGTAPSVAGIGEAAQAAIAIAQGILGIAENVANLGSAAPAINKALSDAQTYAGVLATEPSGDNVNALLKACNDVVAATPAGKIHNDLSAAFAAVSIAVGLWQSAGGVI